ncbi:MAG: hypothetical protein OXI15_16125 [Chromatiales bacterium]|nr:hypothetical protein [Chromatiales bacterium]
MRRSLERPPADPVDGNVVTVATPLGHALGETTADYVRPADAHLVEAVERVGRFSARAMTLAGVESQARRAPAQPA